MLETELGLSPAVVARCHSQVRALFSWALRKKVVAANPALSADPPRLRPAKLHHALHGWAGEVHLTRVGVAERVRPIVGTDPDHEPSPTMPKAMFPLHRNASPLNIFRSLIDESSETRSRSRSAKPSS
jgi:hypothetical protein